MNTRKEICGNIVVHHPVLPWLERKADEKIAAIVNNWETSEQDTPDGINRW